MNFINNKVYSKPFLITLFFKQNKWHRYGVLIHTLKVVCGVIKDKNYKFLAAALFHDIGKPSVAYQDEEDILVKEYSFTDHEEKSYQIVKNWFFLSNWTKNIIRYHYIIRDLKNSKQKGLISRVQRLEKSWKLLDKEFIQELKCFMIYDDYGKH
jgi:putative nucleotidyltransferase with HDIG domain